MELIIFRKTLNYALNSVTTVDQIPHLGSQFIKLKFFGSGFFRRSFKTTNQPFYPGPHGCRIGEQYFSGIQPCCLDMDIFYRRATQSLGAGKMRGSFFFSPKYFQNLHKSGQKTQYQPFFFPQLLPQRYGFFDLHTRTDGAHWTHDAILNSVYAPARLQVVK